MHYQMFQKLNGGISSGNWLKNVLKDWWKQGNGVFLGNNSGLSLSRVEEDMEVETSHQS